MLKAVVFAAVLSSVSLLRAQQTGISGPVEGFTFDVPTGSIRAVLGSLGSATLGPAVLSRLDFASIAPGQSYGIAVQRGQTSLVSGLGSAQVSVAVLAGASSTPEGVAWSKDGSVAVLYSRTGGWIQKFTGLPAAISASAPLSLATLGGALSTVAVDTDGQTLAIGVRGDNAGIYELSRAQSFFSPLLPMSQPIALAFSADSNTLYALDGSTNQLSQINLANSASQALPLSIDDAVAVWPAADGANQQALYIAGRSSRLLLVYDPVAQQAVASIPLSFDPTVIEPLGATSFILRSRVSSGDPLWSFANRGQPVVYFVPAASDGLELHREVPAK